MIVLIFWTVILMLLTLENNALEKEVFLKISLFIELQDGNKCI